MGHARNEPLRYWVIDHSEDDRDRRGGPLERRNVRSSVSEDDLRREPHKLYRILAREHDVTLGPAQFRKSLPEYRDPRLSERVILADSHEHADPPRPLGLLRARRERPHGCA